MKPDRSNYEIWLIDWLEGNLNESQIEELKLFLNENPELREEIEDLNSFSIKPPARSFSRKDSLKKSVSDLSGSQFDYLCIAYLENDLTAAQHSELNEISEKHPEKKKDFELIQKIRLSPDNISYKYKNQLIKRTPIQKIIRLSVIGLSAAATISLFIVAYSILTRNIPVENIRSSQNITVDTNIQRSVPSVVPENLTPEKNAAVIKKQERNLIAKVQITAPATGISGRLDSLQGDILLKKTENPVSKVNNVPVYAAIDFNTISVNNTLITFNPPASVLPYDDGRSKFSRFIAKNFREKILKENTSKDTPLKAYEIAEAGVKGLNKLLGWEMALDERNDENGELKSVYFSSKMLKFNAPLKKSEPLP